MHRQMRRGTETRVHQWNVRQACSPAWRSRSPQPRTILSQPAASDCTDCRAGADAAYAASSGWQHHVLKSTSSALLTAALVLAAPDAAMAAALQPKAVPATGTNQLRATLHEAWGEPCKLVVVSLIQNSPAPMQSGSVSSLWRGFDARSQRALHLRTFEVMVVPVCRSRQGFVSRCLLQPSGLGQCPAGKLCCLWLQCSSVDRSLMPPSGAGLQLSKPLTCKAIMPAVHAQLLGNSGHRPLCF